MVNASLGASYDNDPIPLDGVDVWNTISEGKPSPRQEILLNIDEPTPGTSSIDYQGTAIRVGDMKLLMNVKHSLWYKPPELEGTHETDLEANSTDQLVSVVYVFAFQVTSKFIQSIISSHHLYQTSMEFGFECGRVNYSHQPSPLASNPRTSPLRLALGRGHRCTPSNKEPHGKCTL